MHNEPNNRVFLAWVSRDLSSMLHAMALPSNLVDRHFLLQSIVTETYRLRRDPEMRLLCIETGLTHLSEFSSIRPALRAKMGGIMPRVSSFALLSTALIEIDRVKEAISVCEAAIRFDLDDGTKSGYSGRLQRLIRKSRRRTPNDTASHS